MSIPPDAAERGCAANYPQPVSPDDLLNAQFWESIIHTVNCDEIDPPLRDIVYRSSSREEDISRHVFRWDLTPYQEVFENGFRARRQQGTRDVDYVNLDNYVHHGGRPLDSRRDTTYVFISSTISSSWHPIVEPGTDITVFRYEIYAPGGIWVAQTLGDRYQYPSQEEVCFVEGVARQYIRSAQAFRLVCETGSRHARRRRQDDTIIYNRYFDPQAYPQGRIQIQYPITYYIDGGQRRPLRVLYYPEQARDKREVSNNPADWYAVDVANCESYIDAAFRSSRENEAYLFMNHEYVLLDYAPGSTDDRVVNGPLLICEGFPSLADTAFAEHGIDCAFGSHEWNEAFIFTGNLCALINYAPGTTDDKIIRGPMTISAMFDFFKGTVFEKGVDAAFEATQTGEAYLFRGDQYALINYGYDNPHLIAIRPIKEGFPSLEDTIFASGIEAAFASHRTDEAYIFKGDTYALINFAPGTTDDYIIGGVKKILPNWPSLANILPVKNGGLDLHDHTKPESDRDHDEL
ncbi:hypothetical protein Vadar_017078 [Vaccinium darrowii]|uniref:Uncharacterized protein n=1 Tax=Vaccinium darrowii TaxID=229202 RepID=A0ACB7ZK20_9ERIC|nr:hypothetical protein Vadar_017078 [Vaccinium darrowii]